MSTAVRVRGINARHDGTMQTNVIKLIKPTGMTRYERFI
jgi:hypothetical protein